MGGIFEPITLKWRDDEFVVPSNRVMGAIARVEEVVTLKELLDELNDGGRIRMARLATAYATLLRYAGAGVTDEEIYADMFGRETATATAQQSIHTILALMVPPKVETRGEEPPPGKQETAASSSPPRTEQRSESGESGPTTSGHFIHENSTG